MGAELQIPRFHECSRFNFFITYQPGSKNVKPDALSRQLSSEESPAIPESILPDSFVVASLTWEVESAVKEAQCTEPDPSNGLPIRFFIPHADRSEVLQWVHASRFSCHSGISRTLTLLERHFWWPSMEADTHSFVTSCTVCARSKSSHRSLLGLLRPLPVPGRSWSHITLDFVAGLPPSEGNTVTLTIVDCFSKAAHFVDLPKLPLAWETADLMVQHVFRLHGIPLDIISDRGAQFISQVWKSFCQALGAPVSLSSGFHPQTNGPSECTNQELEAALGLALGAHIFHGLNMLTALSFPLLLACRLSNAPSDTCHHCFWPRRGRL